MAAKEKEVTKDVPAKEVPSLKQEVLDLSKKLEGAIKIDKKTGDGTSENLYEANLPESLNMDVVKEVSNYNTTFIAAGAHAFGQLAVKAMSSNKDLEKAQIDIPMGHKDNLAINVQRVKESINHLGDGEKIIKHGVVTVDYDVRSGKNGGELKKARAAIAALASEKLA